MKKYFIFFFIVVFLFSAGWVKTAEKAFKGRVIAVLDDLIEVKKDRTTVKFFWSDKSEIYFKDKKQEKSLIEICQYVVVRYSAQNKRNEIIRIDIFKESDCRR